jgi:hypothetical protein
MALLVAQASSGFVLANHGDSLWGYGGLSGYATAGPNGCYPNQSRIVMYPPIGLLPTYLTTTEYQQVWWTARIWWGDPDGTIGHTAVSWEASDLGWYYTYARSGDNTGRLVVFPERGLVSGAAYLPWSDQNNQIQPADFQLFSDVNTTISKVFAVEYIYYWAPTERQPQEGWASLLINFDDGYGGISQFCVFP